VGKDTFFLKKTTITNFGSIYYTDFLFWRKKDRINSEANPGLFYLSYKRLHKRDKRPKENRFLLRPQLHSNCIPHETEYEAQLSAIRLQSLLACSISRDCVNRTRLYAFICVLTTWNEYDITWLNGWVGLISIDQPLNGHCFDRNKDEIVMLEGAKLVRPVGPQT
jgi:hypothetical protein